MKIEKPVRAFVVTYDCNELFADGCPVRPPSLSCTKWTC